MPTVNNNKPVDMKQLWQVVEPAPTASSALSALTTSEDGIDRYIYYIVGALFYRYDTYGNCWNKLAPPLTTPTVFAKIRYSKYSGNFGRVISCPSNTTLRIPTLNGNIFSGKTIRIIAGTGIGQERIITATPNPVVYEQGLVTTASTLLLSDNTKKWKYNQWSGYQVRITYGTGNTQIRKILYNNENTVQVADPLYQPLDPFNTNGFTPAPVTTAGSQAHFQIEASDITVDTAWDVNPDHTSRFKIESGGIWMISAIAGAPFYSFQFYDVAADYWISKTTPAGLILAGMAEGTLERTGEIGGVYENGTATSGSTYILSDSSKSFVFGRYKNYRIRITGGTGLGQSRRIICNGTDYFEVAKAWDVVPDATTTYNIIADKDKIYWGGNTQAFLMQYDVDSDLPIQGAKFDDGIANNLAAKLPGLEQSPIAITSGVRSTGGITEINPTPTAGGSNYVVGDILTINVGGANGKVMVESISAGGVVTSISLVRAGATYTTGAGKSTSGGSGTLCTVEIVSTGTVCYVITNINHNFKIGASVILSGDDLYAGTVTITGVDSLTGFDFVTAAAGNMTAANTNSATLIVDSTKNWIVNEHVGKIVQTHLTGVLGAMTARVITANTATTITVAAISTGLVNGTGRYIIVDSSAFGRDTQYKRLDMASSSHATSGTTETLIDDTKNWYVNQWAGYKLRIVAGTGRDSYITIISNTNTTLTYDTQTFTPDTTTHYSIFDSFGTCTGAGSTTAINDTTKNWKPNQWAGKRLRITAGAGQGLSALLNEVTITSNTATQLTFAAVTGFAPDATTQYTILGIPIRGAGVDLIWMFGGTSQGQYMFFPRGGVSNTADMYSIVTETWEYGIFNNPQTDTMTTGTYYAYDGNNRVYFSPGVATGLVQYIYYYDLTTSKIYGFGSVPNTQLAPVSGNRMEIITSPQGISYLYHMRNTAADMYRAQIFF